MYLLGRGVLNRRGRSHPALRGECLRIMLTRRACERDQSDYNSIDVLELDSDEYI